jgi:subtilisin family serine protease
MVRDFGNNRRKATSISLNSKVSNSIGGQDKSDFLNFNLSGTSNVSISLSKLTRAANFSLLDSNGNTILSSPVNRKTQQINTELNPGNYFLRIKGTRQGTDYKLSLAATPSPLSTPIPPSIPVSSSFNPLYGYGLVDAAAAVSKAIAPGAAVTTPFPDVPDGSFPDANKAWQVDAVKAPEVWAQGYKGQGVVVAVLDTGIDYGNSYINKSLWMNFKETLSNNRDNDKNGYVNDVRGWDFVNDDNIPFDKNSHGTFVAGLIADSLTGIAPDAKIMPIQIASDHRQTSDPKRAYTSDPDIANGIYYAVQNGAKIINISYGLLPDATSTPVVQQALKFAYQSNVLVVVSAGNEKTKGAVRPDDPGNFAATNNYGITVGAINKSGQLADFSNPAGNVPLNYVVAPGVNVYSDKLNSKFRGGSGTSYSAPLVSGVAALMLSANPNLTVNQLENILLSTANPLAIA